MSTFGICLVLIALLYTETDSRKPNVVFVLTDDQDVMLGGQVNTKTNREFYNLQMYLYYYNLQPWQHSDLLPVTKFAQLNFFHYLYYPLFFFTANVLPT